MILLRGSKYVVEISLICIADPHATLYQRPKIRREMLMCNINFFLPE